MPNDEVDWDVKVIGNDEGDVRCNVCGLGDWYQAVQFRRIGGEGPWTTVVCTRKFDDGLSCADLLDIALEK